MPISFDCPYCHHRLKVSDASAGKRGKCPACNAPVMVPDASDDSAITPVVAPVATTTVAAPSHSSPVAQPVSAFPAIVTTEAVMPPAPSKLPVRVIVVDFEMSFKAMVYFMVKWAFAAIPAMIIVSLLILFFFMVGVAAIAALRAIPGP